MKKLFSLLLALLICLGLAACGNAAPAGQDKDTAAPPQAHDVAPGAPARPEDGTLEFWITENVDGVDWSGHDEVSGWFGAWEYLGKGYHTVKDEAGEMDVRPDIYVTYVITRYPDYSSDTSAVTEIRITDPTVTLYGLSVNSSLEEWDTVMREMGYEITSSSNGVAHWAEKDGFHFAYGGGMIRIRAEVTNEQGIVF